VIGAFAFLLFNTTRNRLLSQLRRLRTPRYAVGFVLGLGYFWLILGRHVFTLGRDAAMNPGRVPAIPAAMSSPLETVAPVLVLVVLVGIWLFGGDMGALAFSEAEVTMLMTAPVPRRGLILYKLAQSQVMILINVLIWTLILRRGSSVLPGPLSAASVWVIFTTLNLHRMGEALTRASNVEYRAAGKNSKRIVRTVAVLLFVVFVGMLVIEPIAALKAPDEPNPFAFLTTILEFFKAPGVQTVLYPFHLIIAPSFAPNVNAWALAMLPALAIVLLHVFWVLRSDAAFEEAAAMASTEMAKRIDAIRTRRTTLEPPTTAGTKTFTLASTGWPVMAIVWKNAIALRRTVKPGALVRLPILIFGAAAFFGWKSGKPAFAIFMTALIMGMMFPLIALQVLRSDLRTDMMHLPLLKSLPLAGADLVLAEIASSAIPVAIVRFILLAIAGIALLTSPGDIHVSGRILIGVLITLPVTLLAIDTALCTIVNGSAVLFPSWIRLGPGGAGGVEMMGQSMLAMIASVLAFVILLLVPAAFGAGAWFVLSSAPTAAAVVAGLLGSAILGAEIYVMIQLLGRAFERAEPQQIT
jgi:ABC-2 type transport system permease protein